MGVRRGYFGRQFTVIALVWHVAVTLIEGDFTPTTQHNQYVVKLHDDSFRRKKQVPLA